MSDTAVVTVCGAAVLFSLAALVIALWTVRVSQDAAAARRPSPGIEPRIYTPAPTPPAPVKDSGIGHESARPEDRR